MKLTDALLGEHGALYALFAQVEACFARAATAGEARLLAAAIAPLVLAHATLEDELLLPAIEARAGATPLLAVMREEHEEIAASLDAALAAEERAAVIANLRDAMETARSHFAKEEGALFPLAEECLDARELARLGALWANARGVRAG